MLAIGEADFGSHKAHAINTVKTAGGFAALGAEVTLLMREGRDIATGLDEYGESGRLRVRCFGEAYPDDWRQVHGWSRRYAAWCLEWAREVGPDLVYARSYVAPVVLADAGHTVIAETHAYVGAENEGLEVLLRGVAAHGAVRTLTTIHETLAEDYVRRGADARRVSVIGDGVDVGMFDSGVRAMDLGPGFNAVYVGSLGAHKGVGDAVRAVGMLREFGVRLHVFGGDPDGVRELRASCGEHVEVHGRIPMNETPAAMLGADVLLLPNSAREASSAWTSPVKLGEYLASGVPIVASSIDGVRRWVDDSVVCWHGPDDPASMAEAIRGVMQRSDSWRASRRARALALAKRYSYANRARSMWDACAVRAEGGLLRA